MEIEGVLLANNIGAASAGGPSFENGSSPLADNAAPDFASVSPMNADQATARADGPTKRKRSDAGHENGVSHLPNKDAAPDVATSAKTPPDPPPNDQHDAPLHGSPPASEQTTEDESPQPPPALEAAKPTAPATRSSSRRKSAPVSSSFDDVVQPRSTWASGKTRKSYCNPSNPCKACVEYMALENPIRTQACLMRPESERRSRRKIEKKAVDSAAPGPPTVGAPAAVVKTEPDAPPPDASQSVDDRDPVEERTYTRLELSSGYLLDTDDDILHEVKDDTAKSATKFVCGCGQLFDDAEALATHQRDHHQELRIIEEAGVLKNGGGGGKKKKKKKKKKAAQRELSKEKSVGRDDASHSDSADSAADADGEDEELVCGCGRPFNGKRSLSAHGRHCELAPKSKRQLAREAAARASNGDAADDSGSASESESSAASEEPAPRPRPGRTDRPKTAPSATTVAAPGACVCICGRAFDAPHSLGAHKRFCPILIARRAAAAAELRGPPSKASKPSALAAPRRGGPALAVVPFRCRCGRGFETAHALGAHKRFCDQKAKLAMKQAEGARTKAAAAAHAKPGQLKCACGAAFPDAAARARHAQRDCVLLKNKSLPSSTRCDCGRTFEDPTKLSQHGRRCAVAQAQRALRLAKASGAPSRSTASSSRRRLTQSHPSDADVESEPKRSTKVPIKFEPGASAALRSNPRSAGDPLSPKASVKADAQRDQEERKKLRKTNAGLAVDTSRLPSGKTSSSKLDKLSNQRGVSTCPCGMVFNETETPARKATHARTCSAWKAFTAQRGSPTAVSAKKSRGGADDSSEDDRPGDSEPQPEAFARVCEICNKSYRATTAFGTARCLRCIQIVHESESSTPSSPRWRPPTSAESRASRPRRPSAGPAVDRGIPFSPSVESSSSALVAVSSSPVTPYGVPLASYSSSSISPLAGATPQMQMQMQMIVPPDSIVPFNPNFVVVRRFMKRGGMTVSRPLTIAELLQFGGQALGIEAVKVRAVDTEAEITDMSFVREGTPVFLTTAEDEMQF